MVSRERGSERLLRSERVYFNVEDEQVLLASVVQERGERREREAFQNREGRCWLINAAQGGG